jgi:hypothetical protein
MGHGRCEVHELVYIAKAENAEVIVTTRCYVKRRAEMPCWDISTPSPIDCPHGAGRRDGKNNAERSQSNKALAPLENGSRKRH